MESNMGWDEPGGKSDNEQDLWGKKSNHSGNKNPRSLDFEEAFGKAQRKLSDFFGNKKLNNKGTESKNIKESLSSIIIIILATLTSIWLYNAVYVLDEQEQAVILRLGKYHATIGPGLNMYLPPLDRKYVDNVTRERAYTKQGQMLTEDENIIEVPLTVQYKISNLADFVLNVKDPEVSLEQATDSALRHVVGSTSMDQVLTEGREKMAVEIKVRLQDFLDNYQTGISVTQVNVQNASAPREVQEAFDDVIRAREDEQRSRNQAESYSNGLIPESRGQAQRIIESARGYRDAVVSRAEGEADRFTKLLVEYQKSPEVMRDRMYLDMMEDVLSQTSKILVSSKNQGPNSLLYLPLDKMTESYRK